MKYLIIFFIFILIPLVIADTTFFDNSDDSFIMGNSPTGGAIIGGTTDGTTSGGSCLYKWNCTDWEECPPSGKQIRNCINIGTCLDTYKFPEIEQNCTYVPPKKDTKENKNLETNDSGIIDKEKIFIYFFIFLIIGIIIFYLKSNYIKRLIKKFLKY